MSPRSSLTALAAALALTLSACGSGTTTASPSATSTPSATATATSTAVDETKEHAHASVESVSLTFAPAEKGGKTYVLGTLKNAGTEPVTITSASADVAGTVELHKTAADGTMSVDTAGWTLKPGEELTLKDDGFHIAVKNLKAGLKTGEHMELTLQTNHGPAHLELTAGEATTGGHHH